MVAIDLDISVRLTVPNGFLELEDPDNGYELHSDSLAQVSTSLRKTMADGVWVDGSVALRSTRANTQETLAVWVTGTSPYVFQQRVIALRSAFNQLSFQVIVTWSDLQETWTCPEPAEVTEEYQQAFRFATTGIVRAAVMRYPATQLVQVPV